MIELSSPMEFTEFLHHVGDCEICLWQIVDTVLQEFNQRNKGE